MTYLPETRAGRSQDRLGTMRLIDITAGWQGGKAQAELARAQYSRFPKGPGVRSQTAEGSEPLWREQCGPRCTGFVRKSCQVLQRLAAVAPACLCPMRAAPGLCAVHPGHLSSRPPSQHQCGHWYSPCGWLWGKPSAHPLLPFLPRPSGSLASRFVVMWDLPWPGLAHLASLSREHYGCPWGAGCLLGSSLENNPSLRGLLEEPHAGLFILVSPT